MSDLETAYEALATAIDAAGAEREALFLTKLALVLGHELGDIAVFQNAIQTALDGPGIARRGSTASGHPTLWFSHGMIHICQPIIRCIFCSRII